MQTIVQVGILCVMLQCTNTLTPTQYIKSQRQSILRSRHIWYDYFWYAECAIMDTSYQSQICGLAHERNDWSWPHSDKKILYVIG